MRNILKTVLMVTTLSMAVSATQTASAYTLEDMIHKANHLRMSHNELNAHAAHLEGIMRAKILSGYAVPTALREEAYFARIHAKALALKANAVARKAFLAGYVRHGH